MPRIKNSTDFGEGAFTIGRGGQFDDLQDAFKERGRLGHNKLMEFVGSITGSVNGSVDVRRITAASGTPLSKYLHKKTIGVRINGSDNPIVYARIVANNIVELMHPVPRDFSAVNIEVFEINHAAIVLLPGTVLNITERNLIIPAHTTICAAVPYTATINKEGGTGVSDVLFNVLGNQNEIHFRGLRLQDSRHAGGSRFWQLPTIANAQDAALNNLQLICNYSVRDCKIDTTSQDFLYMGLGTFVTPQIGGALWVDGCEITGGGYDVIYATEARKISVTNNNFYLMSHSEAVDGGFPCSVVLGGGLRSSVYLDQSLNVHGNTIDIRAYADGNDASLPAAVDVRGPPNNNVKVFVKNNNIKIRKNSGTAMAAAVKVTTEGINSTAYIEVSGNTIDVTNSGTGGAFSLVSDNASTTIKRAGNNVINGTLGTNTVALVSV